VTGSTATGSEVAAEAASSSSENLMPTCRTSGKMKLPCCLLQSVSPSRLQTRRVVEHPPGSGR
jgi:hypothetical protein